MSEDLIKKARELYQQMNDHDLLVELAVKIEHTIADQVILHKRIDRVERWQYGTLICLATAIAGGLIKLFLG